MKTLTRLVACCCLLFASAVAPVLAVGPIDGEVSALWWANDYDNGETSTDAGSPGLRAELWMLERYGVRASQFGSDPDGSDGADYTTLDVMWRALSPTENNFVAVGMGWQQMAIEGLEDTSGVRVSIEGRIGLMDMLYAYGNGAYLPSLSDAQAADGLTGTFRDLDAYEYEMGVAWKAMPFMNVHAGYRVNGLSFNHETFTTASLPDNSFDVSGNSGGMAGLGEGPDSGCVDCVTEMVAVGASETESSGLFVGLGFQF
jgi:hypothetical protein